MMKLLRKVLRLDNHEPVEATENEIRESRHRYNEKMSKLANRQHSQTIDHMTNRSSELIIAQWGGAMDILRGKE